MPQQRCFGLAENFCLNYCCSKEIQSIFVTYKENSFKPFWNQKIEFSRYVEFVVNSTTHHPLLKHQAVIAFKPNSLTSLKVVVSSTHWSSHRSNSLVSHAITWLLHYIFPPAIIVDSLVEFLSNMDLSRLRFALSIITTFTDVAPKSTSPKFAIWNLYCFAIRYLTCNWDENG